MGGVPPRDNPRAYQWERRLHWVMIGVALLSIPAFLLGTVENLAILRRLGLTLDGFIFAAFLLELLWMLWLTRQRKQYLAHNWLDLLIVIAAAASLTGWEGEWVVLARLLRATVALLFLVRIMGSLRNLFSPNAMPYMLGLGSVVLLIAGAGFYWLEPTVYTYGEGLWLAFTSGATVGYGDIVPTTPASRIFAALIVSYLLGTLYSVVVLLAKKKKLGSTIAFGPFLVVGLLIVYFWGHDIVNWYFNAYWLFDKGY